MPLAPAAHRPTPPSSHGPGWTPKGQPRRLELGIPGVGTGCRERAGRHRLPAGRAEADPLGGEGGSTCRAGLGPGPDSPAAPLRQRPDPSGNCTGSGSYGAVGELPDPVLPPPAPAPGEEQDPGTLPAVAGPCLGGGILPETLSGVVGPFPRPFLRWWDPSWGGETLLETLPRVVRLCPRCCPGRWAPGRD